MSSITFSQWPRMVISASPRPQLAWPKRKLEKSIQMSLLKELDEHMVSNPELAALPKLKKLRGAINTLPADIEVKDAEVFALAETCSNINAPNVDEQFNIYAHTVRSSPAERRGHTATTAGGHRLDALWKPTMSAAADGQDKTHSFQSHEGKIAHTLGKANEGGERETGE